MSVTFAFSRVCARQASGGVDAMAVDSAQALSAEGEVVAGTDSPASEGMETTEVVPASQVSVCGANGETHETNPSNAHAASSDSP